MGASCSEESYEVALRSGVRCIEIDVHDGIVHDGQLIPFVAHANNFVSVSNKIRLDRVLEVI